MLSVTYRFRQQYSTSRALINITENIRKALHDGNTGCGVFVFEFYGIHGVSNDWF